MITPIVQRWRDRRGSYRPAGEVINTREYEVAPISRAAAKAFVLQHHYSGSVGTMVHQFGLFWHLELVGVAIFGNPTNEASLKVIPGNRDEKAELGRFVLLDDVPGNGESWFIARAFELLRGAGLVAVVSFADPEPRTAADGRLVFPGHAGTIYQATNGVFRGRSAARVQRLLPDGRIIAPRTLSKIRTRERNWQTGVRDLVRAGAAEPGDTSSSGLRSWLDVWLPRLTRPQKHAGTFKYLFGLTRAAKRHLPESLPYPKFATRRAA